MPLRQSRALESAHFWNRISFFIRIRVNGALNRLWRAVSKQCGFGDRIDWFRVNGRPIINIKKVCSFKSIWIRAAWGPVHTYPFLFENGYFFSLRSGLPSIHSWWKWSPTTHLFINSLQTAGFSVAFGSTECSVSAGGRTPFAPLARTLSAGCTNS